MSGRTTNHTLEERVNAVRRVTEEYHSYSQVARDYLVDPLTIEAWVRKYQLDGLEGLKASKSHKNYSNELKYAAVQAYLFGHLSSQACCEKYGISDGSVLRTWIKQYTNGEDLKSISKGRSTMTKARKTTHQERVEIAQHCLAEDKNYQKMADLYNVSYSQVYQWVRKYQAHGPMH